MGSLQLVDAGLTLASWGRPAAVCRAVLLWFLAAGGAAAGDTATLDVLGFSADGSVFAFEEFGVEDGTGFAYSTVHLVDTSTGQPLPGMPARVVIRDEAAVAGSARAESSERLAAALGAGAISRATVANLALRRLDAGGGAQAAEKTYTFQRSGQPEGDKAAYRLILQAAPAPGPEGCRALLDGPAQAFSLRLIDPRSSVPRLLHDEVGVPDDRGCPLWYEVAQVIAPANGPSGMAVVLLQVTRAGFEGPDVRYLAVPAPLD